MFEFDFSELTEFIEDFTEIQMDKVCKNSLLEIENRMEEPLKLLTPVDTGHMRESWEKLPMELSNEGATGGWQNSAESAEGFPYPVVIDQGSKKYPGLHITDRTIDAVEPEIEKIVLKHFMEELK